MLDEKDKDKLPSTPKDEKPSTSNLESDKDKTSTSFKPQEEPKTEVITTYEGDSTLEVGKERTEDTKGEKEGVPLIYRVVYKGTQPKVEKESIAFDTLYQGDETKELGFRSIVEGKEGLVTRTTTYQVDKYTGAISSKIFEEKVAPQSQVITLGIKQNSSTKEVPITERFEDSTELEKGKTEVISEGYVGKEVTTVTYKVLADGKIVENSRTVEVTPMRERVVRKGVKEVVSPDKVESLVPKDAPTREELPVFSEGFSESEVLVSGEKTQGDLGKSIVSSKELVPERVKVPDFVAKVTGGEKLTVEGHRDESKINTPSKQERLSIPETTAQFTTNGTGSSSLTAVFGVEADNRSLSTVEHSVITYNQQRGWHKINNQWYFRNSDGKERTGWMKENDAWYYFDANGIMQTGWLQDTDGNWYYLKDNGMMEVGWFQDSSGAWYYLGSSGRMESNTWIYYKGKWYYIDALGKLLFNSVTPDGYRVNEYGEWIN